MNFPCLSSKNGLSIGRLQLDILPKSLSQFQGEPNDWFLSNSYICSEKQILPTIFYYVRTAKNF